MAEPIVSPSVDGQELQLADVDNVGAVAGLADDRVLAELLRLTPYDGTTVYKAVVPYDVVEPIGFSYAASPNVATVVPSGSANGSITINPFRAVVGSRNTASAAPNPNPAVNYQSGALANWRDIRSGIFVGSTTSLTQTIQLAANSTLSPRWDLVYATVAVDANGPSVSRRVKNPSTGSITTQSVASYLNSTVTVSVVQGTSAGAIPALPADSGGNYNIPLAAVRVPNPFTSTSTVSTRDVLVQLPNNGWQSLRSGLRMRPATGNNVQLGAGSSGTWGWGATGGTRPGPWMSPDWTGGGVVLAAVDCSNATPSNWSTLNGGILDDSIDWRNRTTRVTAFCSVDAFAMDPTGGAIRTPLANTPLLANSVSNVQLSNTFGTDGSLVPSAPTVYYAGPTQLPAIAASSNLGLYVDVAGSQKLGALLFFGNTTTPPAVKVFFWIEFSPQFTNY